MMVDSEKTGEEGCRNNPGLFNMCSFSGASRHWEPDVNLCLWRPESAYIYPNCCVLAFFCWQKSDLIGKLVNIDWEIGSSSIVPILCSHHRRRLLTILICLLLYSIPRQSGDDEVMVQMLKWDQSALLPVYNVFV